MLEKRAGDKKKKDPYVEHVEKQHAYHVGHGYKWLTEEVAENYQKKYKTLLQNGVSELDASWELGAELQANYGVTRIEAMNILKGYYVKDYVNRYERIRKLIPQPRKKVDKGKDGVE